MNISERITALILEKLAAGTVPWRQPWTIDTWPRNLVSQKCYRGINVFLLTLAGHACPYWLTYRQAKALGGIICKGERGMMVVYWKLLDIVDEEGEEKQIPLLRYYTVFNLNQCEGIPAPESPPQAQAHEPLSRCEIILANMPNPPAVEENTVRACYDPNLDKIHLPPRRCFDNAEGFYTTLYHELIHSTGHPSRLNRSTVNEASWFGSENYSKEELIAEMGAAFLCVHTGIENETVNNSAAYIAGWLERLRNDQRLVIVAAAQAQRAFEYIVKAH